MKSIKRKHKRMQSKRYFFFMCRKSVAVALCAATLFLSAMPCAGAPAAPEETTLTDDVLNAATLLEELLDFQYDSMKAELSSQITEKGWNRTFTMQSFDNAGNPFSGLNYQETIASLCVIMAHKDILITDISFADMSVEEDTVNTEVPYKVTNYSETQEPGIYIKDGIRYITESGTYDTYTLGEDGYYHVSGTEEIMLDTENVAYGSVTFSSTDPASILSSCGMSLSDYAEEYEDRLLRIQTGDYTEQGIEQSVFLNLIKEQLIGEDESIALESALSQTAGNRNIIINVAASLIGQVPYQWGGKAVHAGYDSTWWTFDDSGAQKGLDCSGFVQWVYMSAGYAEDTYVPMISTSSMLASLEHISSEELMPGDIGIMHDGSNERTNHAGIYLGNGYWIHCSSSAGTVTISQFDFKVYLRAAGIEDSCLSEPVYASLTDNTSSYSEQDIYLLAQTVWHEARGEGMNGWIAVAEVILNRVNSTAYPDTISEVIYQGSDGGKEQFQNSSEISSCTPSAAAVAATRMVAEGRTSILNDPAVLYFRNPGDINDNSDWGNCPFYTRIGNHAFYLSQGAVRPTIEKKEVPLTSDMTGSEVQQSQKEDSYQPAHAESSTIKSEGNIPEERIRNIETNYEKIPENVRKCLIDSGWSYICTDSDFGRQNGINGSILALTVWNTKTIYIDNRKAAESAIIHETGHAVDSLNLGCSFSAEFFSIYQTERDAFCSIWNTHHSNTDTSVEYFAECFSAYVQNPSLLSEHCPATFAYIDNLVKLMQSC